MADHTPVGIIRPIPYGELAGSDGVVTDRPPVPAGRVDERRDRRDERRQARREAQRDRRLGRRPRRRRTPLGRLVRLLAVLVLLAVGYYGITLAQVWVTGRSDQTAAVDAIVVMGAAQYDGRPSPQLAARLDHAAELYAAGRAPVVVVTGGKQPADRFTEAEASAAYLEERGVPESSLVLENEGRTTYDSLRGVADLLEARGLSRVLIVTDPFHSLRSRLIAQDVGLTAYVSPTPTSVVTGGNNVRRHLVEAAGIAVGRFIGLDAI